MAESNVEVKPGFKTTEFWTVATTVLTLLFGTGGLLEFLAAKLNPTSLAGVIISTITSAGAIVWRYISSRQAAKSK